MNKDIIITTRGGIGDILLCTPALRALKECNPHRRIIIYCIHPSHYEVLVNNPYVDSLRMINLFLLLFQNPYHLYSYLFNRQRKHRYYFDPKKLKHYPLVYDRVPVAWLYTKSIKEIVPEIFSDLPVRLQHKNIQLFFTEEEENIARSKLAPYKNVIIMHIFSRSSPNHMWPVHKWEQLVRELPQFTFIQVGQQDEPLIKGTIDWRNKTGIRGMFCLLKYVTSFVGVESCMAHVTNAVGLPGVVLFGDTSPVQWGHDNNINLYKNVRCSPCYHYLKENPCPYTHECMNLITVEEVKQSLVHQVSARL